MELLRKKFLSKRDVKICAHVGFSVVGQSGQNNKKADLSLKMNFFQNFRSRFGFLMQFYHYPELGLTKYAHDKELLGCTISNVVFFQILFDHKN